MSELSRSLVDAAHREMTKVVVRAMERDEELPFNAEARVAVAAVLETLAADMQAHPGSWAWPVTALRRLAEETRTEGR